MRSRAERIAFYALNCSMTAAEMVALSEADWLSLMLAAGVKVQVSEHGELRDLKVRQAAVDLVIAAEEAARKLHEWP